MTDPDPEPEVYHIPDWESALELLAKLPPADPPPDDEPEETQ